jgi:hypothetical protein
MEQFRIEHNEELCSLYRSPGVVRAAERRGLQGDRHVARLGKQNALKEIE